MRTARFDLQAIPKVLIESNGPLVPPIYSFAAFLKAFNQLANNPMSTVTKHHETALRIDRVLELIAKF